MGTPVAIDQGSGVRVLCQEVTLGRVAHRLKEFRVSQLLEPRPWRTVGASLHRLQVLDFDCVHRLNWPLDTAPGAIVNEHRVIAAAPDLVVVQFLDLESENLHHTKRKKGRAQIYAAMDRRFTLSPLFLSDTAAYRSRHFFPLFCLVNEKLSFIIR